MSYLVRTGVFTGLAKLTEEFGVDTVTLLRSLSLPESLFENDETLINLSVAGELIALAAKACECPHLGLLLASRQGISYSGVLGLLMQSASDVGAAIRDSIQYMNLQVQGVIWSLEIEGGFAITKVNQVSELGLLPKHSLDLALAQSYRLLRLLCNEKLQLSEVCFHYDVPEERWIYRQVFGAPVRFNAEFDGFSFPAKYLNQVMANKNDYLHDTLSRYVSEIKVANPEDLTAQVKNVIRQLLPTGKCSILNAAGFFGCDKRTLQRRLKRTGQIYNELVDEERFNLATGYLTESRMPLTTIAELVGFSDISTFSRSFKQRFGVAPSIWRKQNTSH